MRPNVRLRLAVAASLVLPTAAVTATVPAAAVENASAQVEVAGAATLVDSPSGLRSAASYLATFDIDAPMGGREFFPLLDFAMPTEVWGPDAGHVAGWVERSDLPLNLFSDRRQGPVTLDASTRSGTGTLLPGDRVQFGVMELVRNYLAPLDAPRGDTGGRLDWEVTRDDLPLTASYDGAEADATLTAVRADLVVRGGDIDARSEPLATPTLEIPLPPGNPPDTAYSAAVTVAAPAATYVGNLDIVIDPATNRVLVDTSVIGWLPRTVDFTTATGKRLSTWRLPLQIALVADPDAGDATTAVAAIQNLAPSEVVAVSGDRAWRGSMAAGTTLTVDAVDGPALLGPDGEEGLLSGAGTLESVPLPDLPLFPTTTTGALALADLDGVAPTGRETAAWVAAADLVVGGAPVRAAFADGAATMTIDPGQDGRLVLRDWLDHRDRALADAVAPDGIDRGGVRLPLDNLVAIHAWPVLSSIEIGFLSGVTGEDGGTVGRRYNVATVYTDAVLDLRATWLLADGSTASMALFVLGPDVTDARVPGIVSIVADDPPGTTGPVPTSDVRVTVQPPSGPVGFDDGSGARTLDREELVPADAGAQTLLAGALRLTSSGGGDGLAAVTRRDEAIEGDLTARPRPLQGDGATFRLGPAPGTGTGALSLRLSSPVVELGALPPIGEGQCGPAEATDAAGDALTGLDVVEVRVDDDDGWIWATIDHVELPTAAPVGTVLREELNLHLDNFPYVVTVELDELGGLEANRGWSVDRDGTRLRLAKPRAELGLDDGEVLRDVGVVSSVLAQGRTTIVDTAPDGSGGFGRFGTGGTHVVGAC